MIFKRICKITFIAHGATVHSLEGIICDTLKYPKLNEFGEEEMEKVCEYLEKRGVPYDRIYSSPAACCTQSAQIIAKMFKRKVDIIDFPNRNHGEWNGLSYSELFDNGGPSAITGTPKNGESFEAFNQRVSDSIDKLVNSNKGNRIIIVTSPEIIQSALAKALNLPPESQFKMLIKTGSLTQISYFETWSSVIYTGYVPL